MSTTTWFGVICTTLILCLEAEAGLSGVPSWLEGDRCYELDISLCRTYGYNQTALPNSFGQRTEIEAVFHLGALLPLIESGCSSELRFLLCIIYLPVCLRDPNSDKLLDIQPCHQLCRRVYNSCVSTAARMGSDWPATFNCTDLPDADNRDHICFNQAPGLPYTEGVPASRIWAKPTDSTSAYTHTPTSDDSILMIAVAAAGWSVCIVTIILFLVLVCYIRRSQSENGGGRDLSNRRPSVASDAGLMPDQSSVRTWINEVSNGGALSTSPTFYMKRPLERMDNGRSDISTREATNEGVTLVSSRPL